MGLKSVGKISQYLVKNIQKLSKTRHKIVYVYPALISDLIAKNKDVEETLRRFFAKSILKELFLQNFDDLIEKLVSNAKKRLELKEELINALSKSSSSGKIPEDLKIAIQTLPFLSTAVEISKNDVKDINAYLKKIIDALEKIISTDPYYKEYLVEVGVYIYNNLIIPVLVGTKKFQAPDDGIAIVLLVALLINKPVFDLQSLEIIESVLERGFLMELQDWLKQNDFDIKRIEEEVLKKYLENPNYIYPYLSDNTDAARKYKTFISDKILTTVKNFKLVISEHIHASLGNIDAKSEDDTDTKSVILNNLLKAFVEYFSAKELEKEVYKEVGFKKDIIIKKVVEIMSELVKLKFYKYIHLEIENTSEFLTEINNYFEKRITAISILEKSFIEKIIFHFEDTVVNSKIKEIEKLCNSAMPNPTNHAAAITPSDIFGITYKDLKSSLDVIKNTFLTFGKSDRIKDNSNVDKLFINILRSSLDNSSVTLQRVISIMLIQAIKLYEASLKGENEFINKLVELYLENFALLSKYSGNKIKIDNELKIALEIAVKRALKDFDIDDSVIIKHIDDQLVKITKSLEFKFRNLGKTITASRFGGCNDQLSEIKDILKAVISRIRLLLRILVLMEILIYTSRLMVMYTIIYNISNIDEYISFLPEDIRLSLEYLKELKLNYALIIDARVLSYIANIMNPLLYEKLHNCLEKKQSGEELDEDCLNIIDIYGEGEPSENPPELQPDILQSNMKYLIAHLNSVLKFCSIIAYDQKTQEVIYKMPYMKKPLKTKLEQVKQFIEEPIFDKFKK